MGQRRGDAKRGPARKTASPSRSAQDVDKAAQRKKWPSVGQSKSATSLKQKMAALEGDLEAIRQQQVATADVLKVISRSGTNLETVLEKLVKTATLLSNADRGFVFRMDKGRHQLAASFGVDPEFKAFMTNNPFIRDRGTLSGRAALERRVVHIEDAANDPEYTWTEAQKRGGLRSGLGVPLLRKDELIGVLVLYRQRVQRFTGRQIALVTTFADQAVIAIENARLFDEVQARTRDLQESLEYQTAISDVLKAISRSTFELQTVLDTLSATAARLCMAEQAYLTRREGDEYRFVSAVGSTPETTRNAVRFKEDFLDHRTFRAGRESITGRVIAEARVVQIVDVAADPEYAIPEINTIGRIRTLLGVPLMREGEVIGTMSLARQRIEPFTEKQIELIRTFADQAVIAIENTRLLTEQREALEQQTATAEVLQVINSSPGDLAPVFAAMLEKAMHLCGAAFGQFHTYDGEGFPTVALRGLPAAYAEYQAKNPPNYGPGTAPWRILQGERVVHIVDLAESEAYRAGDAARRATVDLGGCHTLLTVALRREETLLGAVALYRQEVRPFSDKQIALLENFAAQAVIAMDNARLLDEIRQRQAELRVTFDNIGDGVVMFDTEARLAAWNRNFQEMLDLPDAFLAGRPSFAEYFRYLAERGEYASAGLETQLSRAVEDTRREMRFERTRPDGRVIEVRRNPVPNGGFVLIYADITERKRAEEAIRAARDAAETALRDLQAAQASLLHAQKMAALGQLTAGIAHEIKNPLNFVNNFAGLSMELLDELKETVAPALASLDEDRRGELDETIELLSTNLDKIRNHGGRADGIVKSMLLHSRGGSSDRQTVDLNGVLEEALNLAYHGARAQDQSFNVTLERDLQGDMAPIEIVPQDITRVFLNLIGNGFYAVAKRRRQEGEAFRPTLKVTSRDLPDAVEIAIRDNGVGIPPQHRQRLFQPFFTTKPTGEGTGLGLSISYDIVTQQHGGTITVDSEPGQFTEFRITLPRRRPAAPAAGRPA